MTRGIPILTDDADLAVECARIGSELALPLQPALSQAPLAEARTLEGSETLGIALGPSPTPEELASLAALARTRPLVLALLGDRRDIHDGIDLATDLGIVALDEARPFLAALALASVGAVAPWAASVRALSSIDRARIDARTSSTERANGRLVRLDDGRLGWAPSEAGRDTIALGEARDVGDALRAMRAAASAGAPSRAVMDGVDARAVTDVLFGPSRALSDPASKAALAPYGIPLPVEELCSSPSRAAAEAARIGFPVKISLASPDLRIWDHPDLSVDGVDSAARVRDVFRQIMSMATDRSPDARLLGVHVSATTTAIALLRVIATPLAEGLVLADIGFADAHGLAADDRTRTVLPASSERLERTLSRLRGRSLLLGGAPAQRRAVMESLADVLLRLCALVDQRRAEIARVEIRPLAVLLGGGVEARETCVVVTDHFERNLDTPTRRQGVG